MDDIMPSISYLNYLNHYVNISLNESDRHLMGHLHKPYFDEIESYAHKILAEWYSEQIIDEKLSIYIKNIGYLNYKIGLLTYKYQLIKEDYERICKLLFNSEIIQLITSIMQSLIETNARHQDYFIGYLTGFLNAYTVIKKSKKVFHQITKQAIESKYYKAYLNEIISSDIQPIHTFFVGIIGQIALPNDNSMFNELYSQFLISYYQKLDLIIDPDLLCCTFGVLLRLDVSYLNNDRPCISALKSLFLHAASENVKNNVKTVLIPILNLFNSICIQSKTSACYLNTNELIDALLQYVTNQNDINLNIYACVLLGHIISEKQLIELRIGHKLTTKLIDLLSQHKKAAKDIVYSLLSLAIHENVQSVIAHTYQLPNLIELTSEYPILYDVIWKLSFHSGISEQLIIRHGSFLNQLSSLSQVPAANGILKNIEIKDFTRLPTRTKPTNYIAFVSSSSDYLVVRKLEEDFQKSGLNIGTAQDSLEIVLCISEESKHDCTCQATIRQALVDCKKIIPFVVQRPYRFDDWFSRLNIEEKTFFTMTKSSIEKLINEIQTDLNTNHHLPAISRHARIVTPISRSLQFTPSPQVQQCGSIVSPKPPVKRIQAWTKNEVMEWCNKNNLNSFTKLLTLYDGRSLLALAHISRMSAPHTIINQLRNDCRKHGLRLSFVEFVRFQAALDDVLRLERAQLRKQSVSTLSTRYVFKNKKK